MLSGKKYRRENVKAVHGASNLISNDFTEVTLAELKKIRV